VIEGDLKVKAAAQPAVFAELQKGAAELKHVETVDKSAPVIEEHAHVASSARPALLDEIKAKADGITEYAGRVGTKQNASEALKAIEAGAAELKHVETVDKSAPVIEGDLKVKAAAQPAVFAELQRSPSLKHVEATNDRSAPVIEAETKVAPNARPALLDEIKSKADGIAEVAGRCDTKQRASMVLKAVESGAAELKHVETVDKSVPVIEGDLKVKAAAQPAVFAELQNTSPSALKKVEASNDRSAPVIEPSTAVKPNARPSILGEIKQKVAEHPAARVSEVMKPKTKGCMGCAVM